MACAIVAIPDEHEPVWKLSSEKIPHMTLLFLGDVTENQLDIAEFVGQVAAITSPFGMSVKSRGPLGPDEADVLFFQKNAWSMKGLEEVRQFLLTNTHIFAAYNAVEQYPEWTPHLTMGYPSKPAKKDDADYNRLSYVQFKKLAVWFGDFEGPTFDLEYADSGEVGEMSMNAPLTPFLAHFGIKGMKWGVRRTDAQIAEGTTVATQRKPGTKLTTAGGKGYEAHDDAKRTAISKQIAKSSTTDALSTKDLQELVNRMNLEQQYSRIEAQNRSKTAGQKFFEEIFGNVAKKQVTNIANAKVSEIMKQHGVLPGGDKKDD